MSKTWKDREHQARPTKIHRVKARAGRPLTHKEWEELYEEAERVFKRNETKRG